MLGFRCQNKEGQHSFCLIARAGVRILFSTNDRWEAAAAPEAAWFTGEGKATARPQILRGKVDYSAPNAARFEGLARAHSADYAMLWAGDGDTAGFRYRIRSIDLPDKPVPRSPAGR